VAARILVVEDNPDANWLMCYLLQARGHTVLSAHDGREGVELATRERPDVVVMDLQMERMGGLEAAGLMAADTELASTPRVAVTAYAMAGDRERALSAGFHGYITKPIDPVAFAGEIEAFLPDGLRPRSGPA
jgi:CheY-like chemotaxis protein